MSNSHLDKGTPMRTAGAKGALVVFAALALAAAAPSVRAHEQKHHVQAGAQAPGKVHIKLPETALTDQHGKALRFKSEAVADRLVLINFIYTTCTTVCPTQSALFADLQQRLGDRVGPEVSLLSVTVDPLRDTPLRLKEFAARYKAGPGWRFLSGSQQAVDEVLTALGVFTPNFADHPAVVLVGDPRSGEWTRFYGFPGSDLIMANVKQLQAARQDAPAAHQH